MLFPSEPTETGSNAERSSNPRPFERACFSSLFLALDVGISKLLRKLSLEKTVRKISFKEPQAIEEELKTDNFTL